MCSITVNITNSTGQGPITFNSFSFLNETKGGFGPGGPPFLVPCNIPSNSIAVQALYAKGYTYGAEANGIPYTGLVYTSGTGVFNMPNGDTLTVVWDLNPESSNNKTPTFTPSSDAYNYSGITNPVITNGNDYVFNVSIS